MWNFAKLVIGIVIIVGIISLALFGDYITWFLELIQNFNSNVVVFMPPEIKIIFSILGITVVWFLYSSFTS